MTATLAPPKTAVPWTALPVLLAGTFMVVLDFFIVNVALPAMQTDLGASAGAVEWVIAGYALTFATLLITAGRLGDQHGRRRMFGLGLALFTAASAACGLAWNTEALVIARLAQGATAALMSPQVLSIMGTIYRGEQWVRAMAFYGVAMGLAAAGGQLIGGALIESGLGWRGCFLINVPIGLAALAAMRRTVPESRDPGARKLDLVGTVLITLGLTAIVLPLVEGRAHGWPAWTWVCLGCAPVTLGLFAAHQRRIANPLTPPSLFADRAVRTGMITQLFFWAQQAAFFLVFALFLQSGRGLSALDAGLVFTVLAVAYLVASAQAPALTERYGTRLIVVGGLTLGGGHLALAATAGAGLGALVPGMLLVGTGMGLCLTPLTASVMEVSVRRPELAGSAAGVLSALQQVGNAIGVAVTGVIFFGAVSGGFDHAFAVSELQLGGLGLLVAAVAWRR